MAPPQANAARRAGNELLRGVAAKGDWTTDAPPVEQGSLWRWEVASAIVTILESIPMRLKRANPTLTQSDLDIVRTEIVRARNEASTVIRRERLVMKGRKLVLAVFMTLALSGCAGMSDRAACADRRHGRCGRGCAHRCHRGQCGSRRRASVLPRVSSAVTSTTSTRNRKRAPIGEAGWRGLGDSRLRPPATAP